MQGPASGTPQGQLFHAKAVGRYNVGVSLSSNFDLLGLFRLPVTDSSLDSVLGQHTAVQLHRRQLQMRSNVAILDGEHIIHRLALDPFRRDGRTGNGGSAAEGLELGLCNETVCIHFNLKLHNITAGGGTHETLPRKKRRNAKEEP